jgi:hypothetical protein
VKPEVDSKIASTNEGSVLLKMKGREPNAEKNNHESETARKPSLILILVLTEFLEITKKTTEMVIVISADQRNG